MSTKESRSVALPQIKRTTTIIDIKGTSPLIMNKFSEEAQEAMLKQHMGEAKGVREPKNIVAQFKGSIHTTPGMEWPELEDQDIYPVEMFQEGFFRFPRSGVKAIIREAAKIVKDKSVPGTQVGGMFRIPVDPEIKFQYIVRRKDAVKNANGQPDIRIRGEFNEWSSTITVVHNPDRLPVAKLLNLFTHAGESVGIGAWRPRGVSSSGDYGCFEIVGAETIDS